MIDGVLTRTVADTAAILDVLAGYEPGDATWAPPPARAVRRRAPRREPRPAADRRDDAAAGPRRGRRPALRAARRRRRRAAALARPRGRGGRSAVAGGRASASCSARSSRSTSRCRSPTPAIVAGREPTARGHGADELGDLLDGQQARARSRAMGAAVQLQAFARQLVAFLEPYDALLTPALAERPLPLGTLDTAAPDPMSTFTRSGLFTPFTPGLQRQRAARDLAAAVRGRGRPAARACSSSGARPARRRCWRSPRSSKRRCRGPSARAAPGASRSAQLTPSTARHRLRARRRGASASARPARGGHRDLHQLGLVPGGERARAQRRARAGAARARRSAWARAGAGGCGPASAGRVRTISSWLSVSGPASS